jgi:hypothetical protein
MRYLLHGAMNEYPSWRHYFDVAIAAAQKPRWFQEGRPLKEREGSVLRDIEGPLERGKIYEGGSLREFERRIEVPGSAVLYVGDHIYGDMLRSKKESAWRTAMVMPELGGEIGAHERSKEDIARQRKLEESRENLEDELRFYQSRFKELAKAISPDETEERVRVKRAIERIRGELRQILSEHGDLQSKIDLSFHRYWGSLMKQDNELSSIGQQVETYADVYMRRVSSLGHYSPMQFFRSPHDLMPHEV